MSTPEELRAALHNARTLPLSPPELVYGPLRTTQERLGAELAVQADRRVTIAALEARLAKAVREREALGVARDAGHGRAPHGLGRGKGEHLGRAR